MGRGCGEVRGSLAPVVAGGARAGFFVGGGGGGRSLEGGGKGGQGGRVLVRGGGRAREHFLCFFACICVVFKLHKKRGKNWFFGPRSGEVRGSLASVQGSRHTNIFGWVLWGRWSWCEGQGVGSEGHLRCFFGGSWFGGRVLVGGGRARSIFVNLGALGGG